MYISPSLVCACGKPRADSFSRFTRAMSYCLRIRDVFAVPMSAQAAVSRSSASAKSPSPRGRRAFFPPRGRILGRFTKSGDPSFLAETYDLATALADFQKPKLPVAVIGDAAGDVLRDEDSLMLAN